MSAIIPATNYTPPVQLSGLMSGMDTESTIQKILAVDQQTVTTAQTAATGIQNDQAAWANVSNLMTNLTAALDKLSSFDTWNQITATPSDATELSCSATSSAVPAEYDIEIGQLAQKHTVASDNAATMGVTDSNADLIAGKVLKAGETFTIQGQTFTVGADEYGITDGGKETLSSLRQKINNAAGKMSDPVFASILDNRLVINRVDTGATQITMTEPNAASGSTPLQKLGIFSAANTFKASNVLKQAQDAQFTVNGATVTRATNSPDDVIENVTLNLLKKTNGDTITLTVSKDAATPKTAIQGFIDSYNAAVAQMTTYGKSDVSSSTTPVLGELQGDPLLESMLYDLRRLATDQKSKYMPGNSYSYNGQTGNMDSLEAIGVWTTGQDNQLSIVDETRLDSLLASNPAQVEQMFRGVYVEGQGYVHGVAGDLDSYCDAASTPMTGSIAQRITDLGQSYDDAETNINKMIDDISTQETDLRAQFTAMEDAIAAMQSDSASLVKSSS